jgi:hopanoid biosynthesis associated radical SAM protein HpnH
MRFPFSLTRSVTGYLLRKRLAGTARYPLVLMLEPLHACNLRCAGCGRIREYNSTIGQRLSVDQCLAALDECGAPVVSICGGEPLIYPELPELIQRILADGKHIYLCTNGVLLEQKLATLPRSGRLFINVHLDGMEDTHDRLVERAGVFDAAVRGIRAAKADGRFVCTNTTVYRETDMHEIAVLFEYLTTLGVDGLMISPGYGYEAVAEDDAQKASALFLTRDDIAEKFQQARALLSRFKITASPIYMDFLCGQRELTCAAWASPTYNVRGWRGPCYLLADGHYASYRELLEATDWAAYGHDGDHRCEHCMMHSGFEPAAVFAAHRRLRDALAMALWQLR